MKPANQPFGEQHPFRTPTISLDTYIRLIQHHLDNNGNMNVVMPLAYIPHLQAYYRNIRFEKRGDASNGYMRCKLIAVEAPK